jgi:hypothetical protein
MFRSSGHRRKMQVDHRASFARNPACVCVDDRAPGIAAEWLNSRFVGIFDLQCDQAPCPNQGLCDRRIMQPHALNLIPQRKKSIEDLNTGFIHHLIGRGILAARSDSRQAVKVARENVAKGLHECPHPATPPG